MTETELLVESGARKIGEHDSGVGVVKALEAEKLDQGRVESTGRAPALPGGVDV